MSAEHEPALDASSSRTLAEIEQLLGEASQLATSDIAPDLFRRRLLDLTVQATSAIGGAVWVRQADGTFRLDHEIRLSESTLVDTETAQNQHSQLLQFAIDAGGFQTVAPHSEELTAGASNPSPWHVLIHSAKAGDETVVTEIFIAGSTTPMELRGAERILATMVGCGDEFRRNASLRELQQREQEWRNELEFCKTLHRQTSGLAAAYTIANDGRQWIACDRLSVLSWRSERATTLAVSGVDSVDRRSAAIQILETLTDAVLRGGDAILYEAGAKHSHPPQIEQALEAYVDQQHGKRIEVLPLPVADESDDRSSWVGALVIEDFHPTAESTADRPRRLASLSEHAAIALTSMDRREWKWLRWWSEGSGKSKALVAGAIALVLLIIALIPVEFAISARGELQPLERREIYAPLDAEIVKVNVKHNEDVAANATLAFLQSTILQREYQETLGDQDTTRKRIESLESLRLANRDDGSRDSTLARRRIAAEIVELQAKLSSIQEQLQTLRSQRDSLHLRAPHSGRVITWDVQQVLAGRPVRRGQRLMTIAQPDGPWIAELRVPDRRIRHVTRAAEKNNEQAIRFIVASDPNSTRLGVVREIGATVSVDRREEPFVRVLADVDQASLPGVQPGTTINARIACGKRPLGYVMTHQLIEAIQTWLFF